MKAEVLTSADRPAWTSTPATGGLLAFNHKHIFGGILKDHYIKTHGFSTMGDYYEAYREYRK